MNKEFQEKLYNDFPSLYQQKDLTIQQSCMAWGCDCNDGWNDLIYKLSEDLTKISDKIQATQVKEKFGGLRFYWVAEDMTDEQYEMVHKLVENAEEKSYQICEECGSTADVTQTEGWIVTLCPKCLKEYYKKRGIEYDNFMSKSMMKRIKVQKDGK